MATRGYNHSNTKCMCGCGLSIGTRNSLRMPGYIMGHEPELDMTQYDQKGEDSGSES